MKKVLILFFILVSGVTMGQHSVEFALKDAQNTYGPDLCLTDKTDFNNVFLRFVKDSEDDLASFTVKISLSESINYTFNSYAELMNVDAKSWLEENNAFRDFNTINFDINATLKTGENIIRK